MAHFAELDANNVVLSVIVIGNEDIKDENGIEREEIGVAFCKSLFGGNTIWKQTSYNHNFRKRYAIVGGTYSPEHDAFLEPKLHSSWILNNTTLLWESPISKPDKGLFTWDEENQQWVKYNPPIEEQQP